MFMTVLQGVRTKPGLQVSAVNVEHGTHSDSSPGLAKKPQSHCHVQTDPDRAATSEGKV